MRSVILGGCLAAVAAGGVYFVAAGSGTLTHCGPCVASSTPAPELAPMPTPVETQPVVHVVDVEAVLAQPAPPPATRFISFDEPPLAAPPVREGNAPAIIQTAFTEPAPAVEVAPMPRRVKKPTRTGPMSLTTPDSPF